MNDVEQAEHSAFTPGPWIVYKGPMTMSAGLNPFFRGIVALLRNSGDGEEVAVILDRNEEAHDYEANARLIAAAPELLEALQAYVANDGDQFLEADDPLYPKAIAAIAKATGVQS